jgi:hypothetical protein
VRGGDGDRLYSGDWLRSRSILSLSVRMRDGDWGRADDGKGDDLGV